MKGTFSLTDNYESAPMENSQSESAYLDMELLRFIVAGSVDNGKSTLIGRLLFDSKAIFQDQLDELERTSLRKGESDINLAYVTDGLRAEREQGITIDVAYRYFHTLKRKFIIADSPGHFQYTRNMVTGASTANAAIILVDARLGIIEQTVRHAYIASLLGIPHIIVCVNKMDLVEYGQEVFLGIKSHLASYLSSLNLRDVTLIPISALKGDNVVERSANLPWYDGPTLMYLLENLYIGSDYNQVDPRFPVQYVINSVDHERNDYRGYAGRIASGSFSVGDRVKVMPSGFATTIKSIRIGREVLNSANAPQSVAITLTDHLDVSRGSVIVPSENGVRISQDVEIMLCWLSETPLNCNAKYAIRHTTSHLRCIIKKIKYKVNINTLDREYEDREIGLNDIACVTIRTTQPLIFDSYRANRVTGSLILIDEATNNTVGAGMII